MQTFHVTQRVLYRPTLQLELVQLVVEAESGVLAECAAREYLADTCTKLPECDLLVDCNPQHFRLGVPPTYQATSGRCWKLVN